jgi:hypothetical protein
MNDVSPAFPLRTPFSLAFSSPSSDHFHPGLNAGMWDATTMRLIS